MDKSYIPYIKSNRFPHLSKEQRAMQFSPFSALEGLDEAIKQSQYKSEEEFEITYEQMEQVEEV